METVLIVDVANWMGSRPDGWWRDRNAAATRLLEPLGQSTGAAVTGPDGGLLRLGRIIAVLEGAARGAVAPGGVELVEAERDGDSAIVSVAAELLSASSVSGGTGPGPAILVVTADRGLRRRLPDQVRTVGPGWLNLLIGR
ncbi:MAG: hypothetical protein ABWZ98_18905 [Nakamurella sp.]